jgi:ADP-ribose pyrophosphatase
VTVLPIYDDDHVAITRQWIYLHQNVQWRLPGGGIDEADASPLDAAKRELAEETGLRAAHWTPMGRINCADSLTNHVAYLFLATGLTEGQPNREPAEADMRVLRLPFYEAVQLAMNDEVPDAGSAHALVMYAARRAGIGSP